MDDMKQVPHQETTNDRSHLNILVAMATRRTGNCDPEQKAYDVWEKTNAQIAFVGKPERNRQSGSPFVDVRVLLKWISVTYDERI